MTIAIDSKHFTYVLVNVDDETIIDNCSVPVAARFPIEEALRAFSEHLTDNKLPDNYYIFVRAGGPLIN